MKSPNRMLRRHHGEVPNADQEGRAAQRVWDGADGSSAADAAARRAAADGQSGAGATAAAWFWRGVWLGPLAEKWVLPGRFRRNETARDFQGRERVGRGLRVGRRRRRGRTTQGQLSGDLRGGRQTTTAPTTAATAAATALRVRAAAAGATTLRRAAFVSATGASAASTAGTTATSTGPTAVATAAPLAATATPAARGRGRSVAAVVAVGRVDALVPGDGPLADRVGGAVEVDGDGVLDGVRVVGVKDVCADRRRRRRVRLVTPQDPVMRGHDGKELVQCRAGVHADVSGPAGRDYPAREVRLVVGELVVDMLNPGAQVVREAGVKAVAPRGEAKQLGMLSVPPHLKRSGVMEPTRV